LVSVENHGEVPLRDREQLQRMWTEVGATEVCMDLTGIRNDVWAPLLRAAIDCGINVRALYVEPAEYRFAAKPRRGEIFQLSERREGLDQIPGFAALDSPGGGAEAVFVPLLGFEGARARHAFSELEPLSEYVVPIVGIPGFRVEYPMHAYQGNELFLEAGEIHSRVKFAMANCPFALFYRLEEIAEDFANAPMRIAMLGTKPHALGAVLYAIIEERRGSAEDHRVGLIHDRPVVHASGLRTTGEAHALVYEVSTFVEQRV
jgi:hypothetical protein